MDFPVEIKTPIKRRRRHSPQFKAQVLAETSAPGASIAAVAQRHNLNANLVQKWRRAALHNKATTPTLPAFIELPGTPIAQRTCLPEVRLELSTPTGSIQLFWPCDQPQSLAHFIKTLS